MASQSQGGEEEEVPKERKRRRTSTDKTSSCYNFNDFITADVKLHLHLYDDESNIDIFDLNHLDDVYLYLHSDVLRRRSQYFSALLSDRWQRRREEEEESNYSSSSRRYFNLTYKVPASSVKSIDTYLIVIELLYSTTDDNHFSETINTVSSALSILPVAIELLFEDCVKACIRLIEALPWTEEEEERVLDLIPLLKEEESQELLSRVSPVKIDCSDEMLCRLIQELWLNHHQKDLVGKMLREFPSKDSVRLRLVLDQEFEMKLKGLKEVLLQWSCSSERQETILWTVPSYGGYLSWLVGRMIELRVAADTALLDRWIDEEGSLTKNLQKVCSDRTISPRFVVNVIVCTWKLANAVATGSIVADRQVRMKLVKAWLPVLLCFKDNVLLQLTPELLGYDFGEPLFKILSTLPMSESQELLLQCVGHKNDRPHLESAYRTWFRRAATQPPKENTAAAAIF